MTDPVFHYPGWRASHHAMRSVMPNDPNYRAPEDLRAVDVCPRCKRRVDTFLLSFDGNFFESWNCQDCGDVVPMRSHVCNEAIA